MMVFILTEQDFAAMRGEPTDGNGNCQPRTAYSVELPGNIKVQISHETSGNQDSHSSHPAIPRGPVGSPDLQAKDNQAAVHRDSLWGSGWNHEGPKTPSSGSKTSSSSKNNGGSRRKLDAWANDKATGSSSIDSWDPLRLNEGDSSDLGDGYVDLQWLRDWQLYPDFHVLDPGPRRRNDKTSLTHESDPTAAGSSSSRAENAPRLPYNLVRDAEDASTSFFNSAPAIKQHSSSF